MDQNIPDDFADLIGIDAPALKQGVPLVTMSGDAFEGASQTSFELALWDSPMKSADAEIIPEKAILDPRVRDMRRNDALVSNGVRSHQDSIVGEMFLLNSKPNYTLLGLDEVWAEEFQEEVESKFSTWAESLDFWPDAQGKSTLTDLVRLAVGIYVTGGEVLASAEWLNEPGRPFSTAIQMIDLDRLSNPNGAVDTLTLRGGVTRNRFGAPTGYHIRNAHPTDFTFGNESFTWKYVPRTKPWGRLQMIHIVDQQRADQTRGVSAVVSALKEMRMTKKYRDIVLQSAALNATYAASIESELPTEVVMTQAGGGDPSAITKYAAGYLGAIAEYTKGARNITIDGVKIPHFFPGTKMKLQNAGTPGGLGTTFEASMLRYIAASLGLSYEQLSKDYTQANYSNLRAALAETGKRQRVEKRRVADRFASLVFRLWLEEALNKGQITSMPRNAPNWYDGLNSDAYSQASWIGANNGQIDGLKETQAAVLRINNGLGTHEDELAALGMDWRSVYRQAAREKKMREKLGIEFGADKTSKNTTNAASGTPTDDGGNPRSEVKGEDTDE